MKKPRWRFILFTSWILFTLAFLLREILLRINSVDDRSLLPWALTHTPSHWALMLVLGTLVYATFIFAPFQLPFMAWWTVRNQPVPALKRIPILLLPCTLISAWWITDTLRHPPDSKAHYEAVMKHPLPVGATHFMALHPLGTGPFAEIWGSVHGYRMRLPEKAATEYCRNLGGAHYDFVVESLDEPYDTFMAGLPADWGYTLGVPHLKFHQLPTICGKPAFAIVDPTRNDLLVMVWQQGKVNPKDAQRLFPTRSAPPDFYANAPKKEKRTP